jgi:hypothetical protein
LAKLFLAVDPVSKQVEKNEESINKNVRISPNLKGVD